jgi:NAD(P)-dependent dehydrogenase (short-subunit alcohol dehydrogenase family)
VKEVEALDRRIVSFAADVRDHDALKSGLDAAVAELGGLDVLVANAGIINAVRPSWELPEADWQTMIDINLSGVWHATKAAVPHIIDRGPGGHDVDFHRGEAAVQQLFNGPVKEEPGRENPTLWPLAE